MSYNLPGVFKSGQNDNGIAFYNYGEQTDTDYEIGIVRWEDDGPGFFENALTIGTEIGGTGVNRPLRIVQNGDDAMRFTSGNILVYKELRPQGSPAPNFGQQTNPFEVGYVKQLTIGGYFQQSSLETESTANVISQKNGTTAQTFRIYNTYTDASNYERLQFRTTATASYIETTSSGTGSDRALYISNGSGTNRGLIIGSTVQSYTDFHPQTDSASDLGITSKRWATTYTDGIATDVETFTAASDTLDAKNNVALCDCTSNNVTINLPVASSTPIGTQYQIKKIDSSVNTVIITPNAGAGDLIDGSATKTLSNQWDSVIIVCDGADWFITGQV